MALDIAGREELWAVSLAFHLPIHHGGSRVQAGALESVPAVPLLSSPREGSGALHKTHSVRPGCFPVLPDPRFSLGSGNGAGMRLLSSR